MPPKNHIIPRDISWLSFNARVLQEANDPTVPLKERIRFLGIHSNNQDEFFRVRVATLKRMQEVMKKNVKAAMHLEKAPEFILEEIHRIVLEQQNEFSRIWENLLKELAKEKIFLLNETQLNEEQVAFVESYYDEEVSPNVIPLMLDNIPSMPYLIDRSIYLGVVMRKKDSAYKQRYALIEVPSKTLGRFVMLPSKTGVKNIMLLEDVIRLNLPNIFSFFKFDSFSAHIFKVTKDAELDIDNDINTDIAQRIEKSLKKRREGKPVRFLYDKEMDAGLLEFLMRKLNLSRRDNIIPGGRIHNFRNFMNFPDVIPNPAPRNEPFLPPALDGKKRIADLLKNKDVMLSFPYHSFTPLIHLLREAAMDADVHTIKLTAYRLASNSKIINALVNAVRNGKQVTVVLELKARFDEEANLYWKDLLEQEGVKVITGVTNMKVHAKLCMIKKKTGGKNYQYGFVSTGNFNEKTAKIYGDHCLMTSNRLIMADINRIFNYLEKPDASMAPLKLCSTLWVCPVGMRKGIQSLINKEIANAKMGKPSGITIKVNSLSDELLINHFYRAAQAGVSIKLIVRGIYCAIFENLKPRPKIKPQSISIVDEYLEHARVLAFHNNGNPKVYISSADFMVRNLDHRVEAAAPIFDKNIKAEILHILDIQLRDNVKARLLQKKLSNEYVKADETEPVRSQVETYHYLADQIQEPVEEKKPAVKKTKHAPRK